MLIRNNNSSKLTRTPRDAETIENYVNFVCSSMQVYQKGSVEPKPYVETRSAADLELQMKWCPECAKNVKTA